MKNIQSIIDTGTTLIYLATDAYNKYRSATGAKLDSATGLLKITSAQFASLQPLNFVIGGTTFALSANAQLWPRSLNTYIGGSSSSLYLVVNDLGSNSGEGKFSLSSDMYEPENASLDKIGLVGVTGMSSEMSEAVVDTLMGVQIFGENDDRTGVIGS